jgi:hypothetical protein
VAARGPAKPIPRDYVEAGGAVLGDSWHFGRDRSALADPNVQARLLPLGYESRPDAPEQVGALLKSEAELWVRVIKSAGIAPLD